ncbi:TPM domain-containing protein [Heyndrickxia sp. NPDC080065]|uniref:TPM domain-containing protein n=1 Tax=Heyndrickxia sp. NPDC080065 TaxID=3390568 RepID=UPI003CFD5618
MSRIRMLKQGFLFLLMTLLLLLPLGISAKAQNFDRHKYIYDDAGLLTDKEVKKLQALSSKLSKERDTAFMVITVDGTDGKGARQYVEDFYDDNDPGYDQPDGNAVILILDMEERDVYLAGFKKAEDYLDSWRLKEIRDEITSDLSDGNYFKSFSDYITLSHEYMGEEPSGSSEEYNGYDSGVENEEYVANEMGGDQENIFFQWWFQLIAALAVAGVSVGIMAYTSGGRVTVNGQTYINSNHSKVNSKYDRFVRQTVTKRLKPKNNNNNGGGFSSGGGTTSGGHSHSGSGGKF